ncbi:hypothetical protein GC169_06860 [bacterium]|nr:hypothetical protein [bacterium]
MRSLLLTIALVLPLAAAAPARAAPPPAAKIDKVAQSISGSETYVPTFGLRASVARGFEVYGMISVDAGLDVPTAAARKRVQSQRPRVFDAMRAAVSSYASTSYTPGAAPDADMLRARMQKAVDTVLGKGEATVALASVIVFAK